jgi:glycosyltransferase involved in cell wall biosynthesis
VADILTPNQMRVSMLVRNPMTHDSRVEKEARTLTEAGYSVTVVATADQSLPVREERDGYRIARVARSAARIPGVRFLAYRARLIEALLEMQPEIIHAHDSDALDPAAAAATRLNVPFLYDAHELWLKQARRGRSRAYWAAFLTYFSFVERRYVPRAAGAMTVSEPIAEFLRRRYRRPFAVVPNYPELPTELAPRQIRSLPGAAGIPAESPIVLRLGGLTPNRGIEQLVRAIPGVDRAQLVLLGHGPLEDEIHAVARELRVGDRVHVLTPVPEDQVIDYAASADVGVSPAIPVSLNDAYSLPNKLFQYMAAGIPVVASDFPHLRQVVTGSQAGLLVDMSDPDRIAAALRSILHDPASAAEMGRSARRAILDSYNWSVSARELLAVYESVTRRSR